MARKSQLPSYHHNYSWACLRYSLLAAFSLLLSNVQTNRPIGTDASSIESVSPTSAPYQGGTVLGITGAGLLESGQVCQLTIPSVSFVSLNDNRVYNDTYMECTMEHQTSAQIAALKNNGNTYWLSISSATGELPIDMFDLYDITIESIAPNEGFNSSETSVIIVGNAFVDTGSIICTFNGIYVITGIYINETSLQCTLPMHPTSGQVNLDVYMNGQPSSTLSRIHDDVTTFTYFVTPPSVQSFAFNPSHVFLILEFDREVEIGAERECVDNCVMGEPTCDAVFAPEAIVLLGANTMCSWLNTQQRAIVVELAGDSAIIPGTSLSLNSESIRTRHVAYSKLASGDAIVMGNPIALQPKAILTAPQYIPYCGDLVVSGGLSQYGGASGLLYHWNITEVVDPETGSGSGDMGLQPIEEQPTDFLHGYLPFGFSNMTSLIIPSVEFSTESRYRVELSVENFLSLTDTVVMVMTKLASPAPSVYILGGMTRIIDTGSSVIIEGRAGVPTCLGMEGSIEYRWSIGTETDGAVSIDEAYLLKPILYLPSHTLLPNKTYTARLMATVVDSTNDATVVLHTTAADVKAHIYGGTRITYGHDDIVLLDATQSKGITDQLTTDSLFAITWSCIDMASNTVCTDTNGSIVAFDKELQTVIAPYTLPADACYSIALNLTYGSRLLSSTLQVICIVDAIDGPRVLLNRPRGGASSVVPTHRTFRLDGSVYSAHPGVARWSCVYSPGYAYISLNVTNTIQWTVPVNEASPHLLVSTISPHIPFTNPVSLVIPPNTLLPRNSYLFRLTATDDNGSTRYTETIVHTGTLPSSGTLLVSPSMGVGLSTLFILWAPSWTDDIGTTPLYYRYGYACPKGVIVWLTDISEDFEFVTVLPSLSENFEVIVEILDSTGSSKILTRPVTVAQIGQISLSEYFNNARDLAIDHGQWRYALAHIVTALHSVNNDQLGTLLAPTQEQRSFKRSCIKLVFDLFRTRVPESKLYYGTLLDVLHLATVDVELDDSNIQSVLTMLEAMVKAYITPDDAVLLLSEAGLSRDEAQKFQDTYANLLVYNSNQDVDSDRVERDAITGSYGETVGRLGYGMCQQLGVHQESMQLYNVELGSLKAYNAIPPSHYNVSCDAHNLCPPSLSNASFDVQFGGSVFEEYIDWACTTDTNDAQCSSVCIVSAMHPRDLHWSGSPYAHHVKSLPLVVELLGPDDGAVGVDVVGLTQPVVVHLPLDGNVSDSGTLECVYWSNGINDWSSTGCSLIEINSVYATCQCSHLSEFAVIDRCSSGYYGSQCNTECPQGLWGIECAEECQCSGRGTCSSHDGSCDCQPGWAGSNCQSACGSGRWGKLCSEQCRCVNGACYHIDGSCKCDPGWIGQYCNTSCDVGYYGQDCGYDCTCRDSLECHPVTGNCTCLHGYVGVTCHDLCPQWYYGEECTMECNCSRRGSMGCDNENGTCFCNGTYYGESCEQFPVQAVPPPLQAWVVATPIVLAILLAALVSGVVVVVVAMWRKVKGRKKVEPIGEEAHDGVSDILAALDEEVLETSDATSLVPIKRRMSHKDQLLDNSTGRFVEPSSLGERLRWEIVRIISGSNVTTPTKPQTTPTTTKTPESDEKPPMSTKNEIASLDHSPNVNKDKALRSVSVMSYNRCQTVVYKMGVYLKDDSTLKDLRNAFVDSGQLEEENLFFKFLQTDLPGDFIEIDNEEETILSSLDSRTVYIEAVDRGGVCTELCVCGKFADMVCTECRGCGYCSDRCQEAHWPSHASICRLVSARRRLKKSKKKQKRERALRVASAFRSDQCPCGRLADFECSVCGLQGYCSEECQTSDWDTHQLGCRKPQPRSISVLNTVAE